MTKENNTIAELTDDISRLKRRIQELEQAESELRHTCSNYRNTIEQYKTMINTITDFIVFTDLDGKILFVNDYTLQLSGFSREQLINSNMLIFISPEDRQKAHFDAMFMLRERIEPREFLLVTRDAKKIPFEINGEVLTDSDGTPIGFIFICRDITARRQSENVIWNIEERLHGIAANIPGVVFQICAGNDRRYRLNYLSKRSSEYTGLHTTDPDKHYRSFITSIPDEDRNGFIDSIVKAGKEVTPWDHTFRYIRSSGETIWLHGLSLPSYHNNEIIFNGLLLDVTEFKQAENRSILSEEKFLKVFMTVPEPIVITRMDDGLFIDTNTAFEMISGWKRSEVIGLDTTALNIWENMADREYLKSELMSGREVINHESDFRRKNGEILSGRYSARSIQVTGEACLVMVIQDITELRRMETERLKLEQQMLHVQKMDAIGQLSAGVAHNFNNILTAIQGNVSMILLHCSSEDRNYNRLNRINESVKRGADLTKQLLGFAKGGKYELKVISINELIMKSVSFFTGTWKGIEADLNLQPDVFPVEVDTGQIEQVLLNLYINSAQAMPKEEGGKLYLQTLNITLQEQEGKVFGLQPGKYVKISVSDNGSGMDSETIKKIFEPFYTTKARNGGTGLGLASVYGIIQNHDGIINAYSEPGHGATFNIYLPASDKNIICDESEKGTDLIYGKGGILIIDDEQPILDFIKEMLGAVGYTVFTASNGSEGIAILSNNKKTIDLVIMDMIMPGIKGSKLITKLREINPVIKIILSSGYSMQDNVHMLMKKGCHDFIQKPFKMADLMKIINKTLKDQIKE